MPFVKHDMHNEAIGLDNFDASSSSSNSGAIYEQTGAAG
jgi:hypothetical protein